MSFIIFFIVINYLVLISLIITSYLNILNNQNIYIFDRILLADSVINWTLSFIISLVNIGLLIILIRDKNLSMDDKNIIICKIFIFITSIFIILIIILILIGFKVIPINGTAQLLKE